MGAFVEWLKGRKTNLTAATIVTVAVAALVNGWGAPELAAMSAAAGTLAATLRAGMNKPIVVQSLLVAGVVGLSVGCAGLSRVNPDTGKTYAEETQAEVERFSLILPPPFSTIIPAATALLLFGGAALAKAGEEE